MRTRALTLSLTLRASFVRQVILPYESHGYSARGTADCDDLYPPSLTRVLIVKRIVRIDSAHAGRDDRLAAGAQQAASGLGENDETGGIHVLSIPESIPVSLAIDRDQAHRRRLPARHSPVTSRRRSCMLCTAVRITRCLVGGLGRARAASGEHDVGRIEAAHPHRPTRRPNTISPFLLLKLHISLQLCNSVPYESTNPPESSSNRTIDDGPDFSRRAADARRRPEEDRRFSCSM